MTAVHLDLNRNGWELFAREHWEKKPAVLRPPFGASLIRFDGYFDALVGAADACRAGTLLNDYDVRFIIDTARVLENDLDGYLPAREDGSIAGYAKRIAAKVERPFALVVNSLQMFSPALWFEVRDFLYGLYAEAGALPAGLSDCHIILGRYHGSPFKLHKDTASVFTFVLQGTKRMLVWPYETFASHSRDPDARHKQVNLRIDPRDYRDAATVLEGRAGDILYWPSSYWHCAEGDGDFHATLHVDSFFDGNPLRSLHRLVEGLARERADDARWFESYPYAPGRIEQRAGQLPEGMGQALSMLREIAMSGELEERLRAKWARRVSAMNFEVVPGLAPAEPLADATVLRCDPRFPVLCVPSESGEPEMLCAANGHLLTLPSNPNIQAMCRRLSSGEPTSVGALLDAYAGAVVKDGIEHEASRDDLRGLLVHLRRTRAVVTAA